MAQKQGKSGSNETKLPNASPLADMAAFLYKLRDDIRRDADLLKDKSAHDFDAATESKYDSSAAKEEHKHSPVSSAVPVASHHEKTEQEPVKVWRHGNYDEIP